MRENEDVNMNLKSQLTAMTQQLLDTEEELSGVKEEFQECRQEIEVMGRTKKKKNKRRTIKGECQIEDGTRKILLPSYSPRQIWKGIRKLL